MFLYNQKILLLLVKNYIGFPSGNSIVIMKQHAACEFAILFCFIRYYFTQNTMSLLQAVKMLHQILQLHNYNGSSANALHNPC